MQYSSEKVNRPANVSRMNNRYFADEYRKSSMYWSSLCDVMSANDGPTQQVGTR